MIQAFIGSCLGISPSLVPVDQAFKELDIDASTYLSLLIELGQAVGGDLVAGGAAAPVAARLVVALPHTPVSLLALVNIHTRPTVRGELVALPAVAPVRPPEVGAVMTADVGDLLALVHVDTRLACRLEALLTHTSVGP